MFQVIDVQDLLVPVKEKAQQAAIEEAKQEAETTTINTLTAQMIARQAQDQKGVVWWQSIISHIDIAYTMCIVVSKNIY